MSFMRYGRLVTLLLPAIAAAVVAAGPARAQADSKRLALIVGNSSYNNVAPLTNPRNDATDFAAKLKSMQFEVILATDADHARMLLLLEEFRSRLTRQHIGLVFFAGHGVTVNNESFLLPVDVPSLIQVDDSGVLKSEALNRQLVSMAAVLSTLDGSRVGLVFLDACRTNASQPGGGLSLRAVSVGTKRAVTVMQGTRSVDVTPSPHSAGMFRAYATQLDNVASDGSGRNSPFMKALLRHIATRGITIQELMIRVRKSVMQETNNQQVPWEEAALNESFSFLPPAPSAPGSPPTARPSAPSSSPGSAAAARPPASRPAGGGLPPNLGVGVGGGL